MSIIGEATEAQWAAIGRYLASRVRSHSLTMDGQACYELRGGWPVLRGRTVAEAVLAAMEEERVEQERTKGGV